MGFELVSEMLIDVIATSTNPDKILSFFDFMVVPYLYSNNYPIYYIKEGETIDCYSRVTRTYNLKYIIYQREEQDSLLK